MSRRVPARVARHIVLRPARLTTSVMQRIVACAVVVGVALAGSVLIPASRDAVAATRTAKVPKPNVPAPPPPSAVPSGGPSEQAAALADATDQRDRKAKGGIPAILRAFALTGIPVVDHDGLGVNDLGDDIGGPPWWLVRMLQSTNPQVRLTLVDVANIITKAPELGLSKDDDVAGPMLADLRADAASADPHRQFFAQFIAAGSRQAGGADPLDPATTPAQVRLDAVAQLLLISVFERGLLAALPLDRVAVGGPGKSASAPRAVPLAVPRQAPPMVGDCNPSGDDEAFAYWAFFVASKLAGGLQIAIAGESTGTASAIDFVVGKLGGNPGLAGKLGTGAAALAAAMSVATFLIQLLNIELIGTADTLTRTKSKSANGEAIEITVKLIYNLKGKAIDGGGSTANCFLNLLNGIGIQASLPQDGAVPNTPMKVEPLEGFSGAAGTFKECGGDAIVVTGPRTFNSKPTTNEAGEVKIPVQGCKQKETIPDDAPEVAKEYSIKFSSQLEEFGIRTIASTFVDSFFGVSGKGAAFLGLVAAATDIAKGFNWDLGEQVFPLIDWDTPDYKLEQAAPGGGTLKGTKCDSLDGEWVFQAVIDSNGVHSEAVYTVTIAKDSLDGTYQWSDSTVVAGAVVAVNASGHASLAPKKDGNIVMKLDASSATSTAAGAGGQVTVAVPHPAESFTWKVDAASSCDEPN